MFSPPSLPLPHDIIGLECGQLVNLIFYKERVHRFSNRFNNKRYSVKINCFPSKIMNNILILATVIHLAVMDDM